MDIQDLQVLEERIEALLNYCQGLEEKKAVLETSLAAKESRIKELEAKIDELNQERLHVRERVSSLISRIDQLGSLLKANEGPDEFEISQEEAERGEDVQIPGSQQTQLFSE